MWGGGKVERAINHFATTYVSFPRDNASVLANFERYLKLNRALNPRTAWLQEIYLKVDTSAIITALKQIYK